MLQSIVRSQLARLKRFQNNCVHSYNLRMYSFSSSIVSNMHHENIFSTDKSETVQIANQYLRAGEVIALPTDTVYGLAADANNELAIQKLYSIKGRDFHKPVAICVKDFESLRHWGQADHLSNSLLEKLLPGPITIVIERAAYLSNRFLNPSTTKIGIRIPDCEFIQKLCDIFIQPLALTSANRSSEKSSLQIDEFKILWPDLGGIFNSGPIGLTEECRFASTVIDLSNPGLYKIIRKGVALKNTISVMEMFNISPLIEKY